MNKKALRHSFNSVLNAAESKRCEDLHHKPSQYHKEDYVCPAEYELHKHCHILREYLKEQGIIL